HRAGAHHGARTPRGRGATPRRIVARLRWPQPCPGYLTDLLLRRPNAGPLLIGGLLDYLDRPDIERLDLGLDLVDVADNDPHGLLGLKQLSGRSLHRIRRQRSNPADEVGVIIIRQTVN